MKVTKELLQLMCKALSMPTTGTKEALRKRICSGVCVDNSDKKPKTLRSLVKAQDDRVDVIVKDIVEMLEDDSTEISIIKSLGKLHNVKIEKNDVIVFAELYDAAQKRDYSYIEEKLEEWGTKGKWGVELMKVYNSDKNKQLSQALSGI